MLDYMRKSGATALSIKIIECTRQILVQGAAKEFPRLMKEDAVNILWEILCNSHRKRKKAQWLSVLLSASK